MGAEAPDAWVAGVGRLQTQHSRHELPVRGEEEVHLVVLPGLIRLGVLGGISGFLGHCIDKDPVPLQLTEIFKELGQGVDEVIISLPSHGDGQHVVMVRLQHHLPLIQHTERDHRLLLKLAHLPAVSLHLDANPLIWLDLHTLENVRQEVLDPLVRSNDLVVGFDLVQWHERLHRGILSLTSLVQQVIPDHSHLNTSEESVCSPRSRGRIECLESLDRKIRWVDFVDYADFDLTKQKYTHHEDLAPLFL